jgi:hypothetical protein
MCLAWLVIGIGLLAACTSTVQRVTDPSKLEEFSFLQPGVTSIEEVEARLGPPTRVYEDGRIATYAFRRVNWKYEHAAAVSDCDHDSCYHLVLVYGAGGVLDQWSLVHAGY